MANKYGSDKGNKIGEGHGYTFLYELLFHGIRKHRINFLEIGLALGGPEVGGSVDRAVPSPSVQMWLEYFPHAAIYGFDICDFAHMEAQHPRFHFARGDCGSISDLEKLANSSPRFDVVLDDASHASFHQQNAFRVLFPRVAPGGLYIIEDLHWQSPVYEMCLPAPKTWEFFWSFFVESEYRASPILGPDFMNQISSQVQSFCPFHDFSGASTSPKLLVFRRSTSSAS
ncbi:MAG TPA: hypothetical protein VGB13_09335 [Candidatus Krumholzibacteria bacterium]